MATGGKKVMIGAKPQLAQTPDAWVDDKAPTEPVKRLTLDIPADLHRRIKSDCALNDLSMVGEITKLLEKRWPK